MVSTRCENPCVWHATGRSAAALPTASLKRIKSVCFGFVFGVVTPYSMASILLLSVSLEMRHESSLLKLMLESESDSVQLPSAGRLLLRRNPWSPASMSRSTVELLGVEWTVEASELDEQSCSARMVNQLLNWTAGLCQVVSGVMINRFLWFLCGVAACVMWVAAIHPIASKPAHPRA